MNRIDQIIKLELEADSYAEKKQDCERKERERRWEAARLISEELASGTTQRALAAAIHKSKTHVLRMDRCWKIFGEGERYLKVPFNEAYNSTEVRGEPKPKADSEEKATEEALIFVFLNTGRRKKFWLSYPDSRR